MSVETGAFGIIRPVTNLRLEHIEALDMGLAFKDPGAFVRNSLPVSEIGVPLIAEFEVDTFYDRLHQMGARPSDKQKLDLETYVSEALSRTTANREETRVETASHEVRPNGSGRRWSLYIGMAGIFMFERRKAKQAFENGVREIYGVKEVPRGVLVRHFRPGSKLSEVRYERGQRMLKKAGELLVAGQTDFPQELCHGRFTVTHPEC